MGSVPQVVQDVGKALHDAMESHTDSYLKIGSVLLLVRDQGLWKEFGNESFADFCTHHGLSRSWSYQCIGVVERFGERAKGILPSRLQMLLPIKASKEEEDGLLTDARLLASEAFRNVLVERKGGKTTDTCDHHELGSYCKACGRRVT